MSQYLIVNLVYLVGPKTPLPVVNVSLQRGKKYRSTIIASIKFM